VLPVSGTAVDLTQNEDAHTHILGRPTLLEDIIIIIINKVLIKVTLNKVIAGALYTVICG